METIEALFKDASQEDVKQSINQLLEDNAIKAIMLDLKNVDDCQSLLSTISHKYTDNLTSHTSTPETDVLLKSLFGSTYQDQQYLIYSPALHEPLVFFDFTDDESKADQIIKLLDQAYQEYENKLEDFFFDLDIQNTAILSHLNETLNQWLTTLSSKDNADEYNFASIFNMLMPLYAKFVDHFSYAKEVTCFYKALQKKGLNLNTFAQLTHTKVPSVI